MTVLRYKTGKKTTGILTTVLAALLLSGCTVSVSVNTPAETGSNINAEDTGDRPDADISVPETEDEAAPAAATLKDAVVSEDGLGVDATVGACINSLNVHDAKFMEIITQNCNVVTLENELKPDAMFGYNNEFCPLGSVHEEDLNGETIQVPTLDHSRADGILDVIAGWNSENPDRQIKVRGHVLVWHSQTPEWFFHEDYDAKADYVSAEVMNRRMEWYIKSMLEYYTGSDSKYNGMFYGWDVVNEAISDRSGSYRTDAEQSSWWKVYGSNEYIINAFRYANKYAPADLMLYYNDYNECDNRKRQGILTLISDVKAADGTRLDGYGMQGHYTVFSPTAEQIEEAATEYAQAAGSVMLTELDVKTSMFYRGTKEDLPEENLRQAKYYASIFEALKKLHGNKVNFTGITFWGMSDKYTWLEGHHPLPFDENYEPKPAFYAFTDPASLPDDTDD